MASSVAKMNNTTTAPSPTIPRKRSRSAFEDLEFEEPDQPSPSRSRTRRSPSPSPSPSPPATLSNHPRLLDVKVVTSVASARRNHPYLCHVGNPPARPDCAICLDSFDPSVPQSVARHARCSPVYHVECLEQWVEQGSATCPYCRARLLPPLFEDEDHDEDDEETVPEEHETIVQMIALGNIIDDPIGFVTGFDTITRLARAGHLSPRARGGDDEGHWEIDEEEEEGNEEEGEEEEEPEAVRPLQPQQDNEQESENEDETDMNVQRWVQQFRRQGFSVARARFEALARSSRGFWDGYEERRHRRDE